MSKHGIASWKRFNGKLEVRNGTRAGWIEMVFTKKDGTQVKAVAKKVGKFYSETQQATGKDVI